MSEPPFDSVLLTPLRRAISARMSLAATIPHFRLVADIEVGALLTARDRWNAAAAEDRVSLNDCVVKACASALIAHPEMNVQLVDDELRRYRSADISVVVAVDGGLATPVVRGAEKKTVREIGAEVRALAARAAVGRLKASEISGGCFSVSNLGAFGVDQFDAILNPPQCAILAVGRTRRRMVVSDAGLPRIATLLRTTLSVDHRAIDGAMAAPFLATLRAALEQPASLFLETGSSPS